MAELTNFVMYRNGAIKFTAAGTSIDGRIGILRPSFPPILVTHNGHELAQDAQENVEIERVLSNWLRDQMTSQAEADLAELDGMREWRNLPDRFDNAVLLHRVRGIIERLKGQSSAQDGS